MLKITYTDTAPQVEYSTQSIEDLVAHHIILALRTGQPLTVESGKASLLLPIALSDMAQFFLSELRQSRSVYPAIAPAPASVELYPCDESFLELSLDGVWIAATAETHMGLFLTNHSPWVEKNVLSLWHQAQPYMLLRQSLL